jgi:Ser/Thr protein kinase RdoA (MazF antagonist)
MSLFDELDHPRQIAGLNSFALTALGHWEGEFDQVSLVKYRENAVYSAVRSDGERIALRIHRDGYHHEAALQSELQWMELLAEAGIQVPQVIRTRAGTPMIQVHCEQLGISRYVDMLGWLPGTTLGSAEEGLAGIEDVESIFHEVGVLAARIHLHSSSWQQPNSFVRHAWDEDGLIGHQPFWGTFWALDLLTEAQRELLQTLRHHARIDLRAYGRTLANYGMIHADLVPENLLVEEASLRLIDFDDAGFGWHMFELATALYFCLDDPRLEAIRAALLAGYDSVKPLTPQDRQALPLFLALRGVTYLGWIHTRPHSQPALELAPLLIERACILARHYLQARG